MQIDGVQCGVAAHWGSGAAGDPWARRAARGTGTDGAETGSWAVGWVGGGQLCRGS